MAVTKGFVLGAANVVLIAMGMGLAAHDGAAAMLVVVLGGVPGMLAGGVLGWLAQGTAAFPPALRVALLVVPAVAVVFVLADAFGVHDGSPHACIPTVLAALVLERWTRRVSLPPVPVATARAPRDARRRGLAGP